MQASESKQQRQFFILFLLICIVGTGLGRNPNMHSMRMVDQLQLVSLGILIGTLLTQLIRRFRT